MKTRILIFTIVIALCLSITTVAAAKNVLSSITPTSTPSPTPTSTPINSLENMRPTAEPFCWHQRVDFAKVPGQEQESMIRIYNCGCLLRVFSVDGQWKADYRAVVGPYYEVYTPRDSYYLHFYTDVSQCQKKAAAINSDEDYEPNL